MKPHRYNTVICDLGNVLIDFDHRIASRKILKHTRKDEDDIYNLFFDSGLTELYEEGRISQDEFFEKVRDELELGIDKDGFFSIWNDIFFETPLNINVQDFLKKIKPGYALIMVSNLNVTHFEFLRPRMEKIFKEFDKLVLSYEVGFRKPAPQIYKVALDFASTTPDKTYYIDDRQDLIESAGRLGIKGVVFDGEDALRKIEEDLK